MTQGQTFSYIKGYSFHFDDQGHQIEAWFSCLSGREKLLVDGELIKQQRSISRHSVTGFTIDGQAYKLNMDVVSLLTGPFVCTLSKNGQPIKRQKLVFPESDKDSAKSPGNWKLLPLMAAGAVAGFAMASGQLTIAETIAASIALLVPGIFFAKRNGAFPRPIIEEEALNTAPMPE